MGKQRGKLVEAWPKAKQVKKEPINMFPWVAAALLALGVAYLAGRIHQHSVHSEAFGGDPREAQVKPQDAMAAQWETELNYQLRTEKRSGNLRELFYEMAYKKKFVHKFWEQRPVLLKGIELSNDLPTVESIKAAGLRVSQEVWFTKRRGNPMEGVIIGDRYSEGTPISPELIEEELQAGSSLVMNGAGTQMRDVATLCFNASGELSMRTLVSPSRC